MTARGFDAAAAVELVRAAAAQGLTLAVERVRGVAVPLTPLEYGDLRSSLTVDVDVDALQASVSTDLPYSVKQHEDLSLRHDDGQAKYLEAAALRSRGDVEAIMAAQVRRALGG